MIRAGSRRDQPRREVASKFVAARRDVTKPDRHTRVWYWTRILQLRLTRPEFSRQVEATILPWQVAYCDSLHVPCMRFVVSTLSVSGMFHRQVWARVLR
jgi:hypothetical protein